MRRTTIMASDVLIGRIRHMAAERGVPVAVVIREAVEDLRPQDCRRVREICDRYADADVGFVDAAILAIVERMNETKLATLDHRHFSSLRPHHVDSLTLLP
jgi:predicted nucleic acid-binding protein